MTMAKKNKTIEKPNAQEMARLADNTANEINAAEGEQSNEQIDLNDVIHKGVTHAEIIRAQALAAACKYYTETIVKDGDLYREMMRDNRVLKPATYWGVLEVALAFEAFLSGNLRTEADAITEAKKRAQVEADTPIQEPSPTEPSDRG